MKTVKKSILFASLPFILCTGVVACQRETISAPDSQDKPMTEELTTRTLTATLDQADTKADIASLTGAFTWATGDQIAVHTSAGQYYTATLQSGAGSAHATFSGDMSGVQDGWAVFPASIVDGSNWGGATRTGTLKITLPATYTISGTMGTSSPLPMIAKNTSSSLAFQHIGAAFRLTLYDVPTGTRTITVMTDQQMSGSFTVNTSTGAISSSTNTTLNKITYTLSTALAAKTTLVLNVPVPTGTFNTLTVCAYNSTTPLDKTTLKSKGYNDYTRVMGRAGGLEIPVDMEAGTNLFDGFRIAPGNLYYDGSAFKVADTWTDGATALTNKLANKTEGAYIFSWYVASEAFNSTTLSTAANNVMNNMASGSPCYSGTGWLIVKDDSNTTASYPSTSPATTTWAKILTTDKTVRAGSTVNGSANKHYARIKVSDYTYSGDSTPEGCLIFPDNKTITGQSLTGSVDAWSSATSLTVAQLNVYISQGCVFLPAAGFANGGGLWTSGGNGGYYWSGTTSSGGSSAAYLLFFGDDGSWITSYAIAKADYYFSVRPVR